MDGISGSPYVRLAPAEGRDSSARSSHYHYAGRTRQKGLLVPRPVCELSRVQRSGKNGGELTSKLGRLRLADSTTSLRTLELFKMRLDRVPQWHSRIGLVCHSGARLRPSLCKSFCLQLDGFSVRHGKISAL